MRRHRTTTLISLFSLVCLLATAHAGDSDPAVKSALDDLTAKGSVKRLAAVATLREAGWSDTDVMRLTFQDVFQRDHGRLVATPAKFRESQVEHESRTLMELSSGGERPGRCRESASARRCFTPPPATRCRTRYGWPTRWLPRLGGSRPLCRRFCRTARSRTGAPRVSCGC